MRKIFKYILDITYRQTLTLPMGATILSVANQNDKLCMWVLIDPNEKGMVHRSIKVYGTGHPISNTDHLFVGTAVFPISGLVWHVFAK